MLTTDWNPQETRGEKFKPKKCKEITMKEDLHTSSSEDPVPSLCYWGNGRLWEIVQDAQSHMLLKAESQLLSPGGLSKPSKPPPMLKWNNPHLSERVGIRIFYRQNDGCDDLSRSLPTSKFYSLGANNCCHQVLWVRPRPVTNFPTKSGAEQETGLLKDHC